MPNSNFAKVFGKRLGALREERNVSQEALGFAAKLHRTHISLIERGRRSVRLETIYQLAWALGVQPSELMPTIKLPNPPRLR